MLNKKSTIRHLVSRRAFIIGAGNLSLFFILAGKMFYMQFIKKNKYRLLSDKNRIKTMVVAPSRGQIYDIAKRVIAKNSACFRLLLDKSITPFFIKEVKTIAQLLELNCNQIQELNNRIKKAGRRIPTIIIDCLSWKQISVIEEQKEILKSLFIDAGNVRHYEYGEDAAHLLGYMGRANENIKVDDLIFADNNFKIGKDGVERYYEGELRGKFGYKEIEVNAYGNYVKELSEIHPSKGSELYLNIDAELQRKIVPYLNNNGCSAIVMNCLNGGILSCCSVPSYDPNNFNSLSEKNWTHLIQNPNKPLMNKTIHSLYPPGSIFKLITILAALESGIDSSYIIKCNGGPALGGNSFRCSKKDGHGSLNMHDAIMYSCNIYIFEIAKLIGANKIISTAKKFGFGSKTGIDLPSEVSGFVPTIDWKKKEFNSQWSLGDTFNLSIGQGFLLCTPMQLARFITGIANNGKLYTPRILNSEVRYTQLDIKKEHITFLKEALYNTVNKLGGTGYSSRLDQGGISMAGKTGTAQVMAKKSINDNLSRSDIERDKRNHAIFTGYAPSDQPKYTVTVYYDHGGGGGKVAAPIARAILEQVLARYPII